MIKRLSFLLALCIASLVSNAQDVSLDAQSAALKKILKTQKAVLRGYNFGDSKVLVKESEDATLEKENSSFLVYKIQLDVNEVAEVKYTFDANDKIIRFAVSFIENINLSSEQRILDDFQAYFTQLHGKFFVDAKNDEVWSAADGYIIEMGNASELKGDLLKIEIEMFQKNKAE